MDNLPVFVKDNAELIILSCCILIGAAAIYIDNFTENDEGLAKFCHPLPVFVDDAASLITDNLLFLNFLPSTGLLLTSLLRVGELFAAHPEVLYLIEPKFLIFQLHFLDLLEMSKLFNGYNFYSARLVVEMDTLRA